MQAETARPNPNSRSIASAWFWIVFNSFPPAWGIAELSFGCGTWLNAYVSSYPSTVFKIALTILTVPIYVAFAFFPAIIISMLCWFGYRWRKGGGKTWKIGFFISLAQLVVFGVWIYVFKMRQ